MIEIYEKAFADRVALLYLTIHRKEGWPSVLEEKYLKLSDRRDKTLDVVVSLGQTLNEFCQNEYAIFKSLKPYPATPNDTDVILFGDKDGFNAIIDHLFSARLFDLDRFHGQTGQGTESQANRAGSL